MNEVVITEGEVVSFWHFPKSEFFHSLGQTYFSVLKNNQWHGSFRRTRDLEASQFVPNDILLLFRQCTPFILFHTSMRSLLPSVHYLPFHIWADLAPPNAGSWVGKEGLPTVTPAPMLWVFLCNSLKGMQLAMRACVGLIFSSFNCRSPLFLGSILNSGLAQIWTEISYKKFASTTSSFSFFFCRDVRFVFLK